LIAKQKSAPIFETTRPPVCSNARGIMRKFLNAVVLIPLGLIFVVFAVANRHLVTVSFDPFNSTDPSIAITLPLFVVIIAAAIAGVAAGGTATWFRQHHWRRAARQHEADARQARAQLAELRPGTAAQRGDPPRVPALAQGGGYGLGGRDKQGATL
jgi:uncharacterized integral membrane protein